MEQPIAGSEVLRLEALDRLMPSIPYGTSIAVFFDSDSDWFSFADFLIASGLRAAPYSVYVTYARFAVEIRTALIKYVPDLHRYELLEAVRVRPVEERTKAEVEGKTSFAIVDNYSWVTGKIAQGEYAPSASEVNLSTLSAIIAKETAYNPPGTLNVEDNMSAVVLHTDEKSFLKFFRTLVGRAKVRKQVSFFGFTTSVHSPSFYAMIGASTDGVMEVRHLEVADELSSLVRVRNLRNVAHERRFFKIIHPKQGFIKLEGPMRAPDLRKFGR